MFRKRTILIVGAGASQEVQMPTGAELKGRIRDMLDIRFEKGYLRISGDEQIVAAIKRLAAPSGDFDRYLDACWHIRDAMPQALSIDNFLDVHQKDVRLVQCGKLAIVRSILQAESSSLLFFDEASQAMNFSGLQGTWYHAFLQLLTEYCSLENLPERLGSITLIVFNYDRCFEHYLLSALQTYYRITVERAAELIGAIQILHPYGTVGSLPWQRQVNGAGAAVEFGGAAQADNLIKLASNIKTFAESTDPEDSQISAIRSRCMNSESTVFLGFAFHIRNLELLTGRGNGQPPLVRDVDFFGTAKGISRSDCQIIEAELRRFFGARLEHTRLRNDLTCAELFREYWRSFSLQ